MFLRLAKEYNALVPDDARLAIDEPVSPREAAVACIWVLEAYERKGGTPSPEHQGTAFFLAGFGLITCAHCVASPRGRHRRYSEVIAYKAQVPTKTYKVEPDIIDNDRDIAVCRLRDYEPSHNEEIVGFTDQQIVHGLPVTVLGFPTYAPGATHTELRTSICGLAALHGVQRFDVEALIRKGNSGGPVIDDNGRLVGIAAEGALEEDRTGRNVAISYVELVAATRHLVTNRGLALSAAPTPQHPEAHVDHATPEELISQDTDSESGGSESA